MKRNGSKPEELGKGEKYYRIEYTSLVDGYDYWEKVPAKSKKDAIEKFGILVSLQHVENVQSPILLDV